MEGNTAMDALRIHRERHQKIQAFQQKYKDLLEFDPIQRSAYRITGFVKRHMFQIPVNITEDQLESIPGTYRYRVLLDKNNLKNKKVVKTSKLVDFSNVKVPKKKSPPKPQPISQSKPQSVKVNTGMNTTDKDIMDQVMKESLSSYKGTDDDLEAAIMASLNDVVVDNSSSGNTDQKSNGNSKGEESHDKDEPEGETKSEPELKKPSNPTLADFMSGESDLEKAIKASLKDSPKTEDNDSQPDNVESDLEKAIKASLKDSPKSEDNNSQSTNIESDLEKAIKASLETSGQSTEDEYRTIKESMGVSEDPYEDDLKRALKESKKEHAKKKLPKISLDGLTGLTDDMKSSLIEGINEFLQKNPSISNISVNGKKREFPDDKEIEDSPEKELVIEDGEDEGDDEALAKALAISKAEHESNSSSNPNSPSNSISNSSHENTEASKAPPSTPPSDSDLDQALKESKKDYALDKALEESKKLHQQKIDKVLEESKKEVGIALDSEEETTKAITQSSVAQDEALARAIAASMESPEKKEEKKQKKSPKEVKPKDPSAFYVCLDLRVYGPIPTQSIFVGDTEYVLTSEQRNALRTVWGRVDPDTPSGERYNQDRMYDKVAVQHMLSEGYY